MYDRSAILRSAHALARHRVVSNRAWRTYRIAFADALRREWAAAKRAAIRAAIEAEDAAEAAYVEAHPLLADVTRHAADLRMMAEAESFTWQGSERRRALLAEADEFELAARNSILPAMEPTYAAF